MNFFLQGMLNHCCRRPMWNSIFPEWLTFSGVLGMLYYNPALRVTGNRF